MTKALCKEIMHRSKLKNILNKNHNDENRRLYKRQRNICLSLLRKEKRNYYNNLDLKIFEDNMKFWRSIKPLFCDKQKILDKNIIILDDGIVYSKNEEVAEKLNNFSIDAVCKVLKLNLLFREKQMMFLMETSKSILVS